MATRKWIGGASAVAQVDTLTVGGTVEAGDKFNMTIGGKVLSVSATTTSTATTATEIATAWNASTIPEFAEVTAAANGSTVVLTADTAGMPFTVTVETTEAGGGAADLQTFSLAATTANEGPNDWSTPENWSGATVPVGGDTVIIENSSDAIKWGLDQSAVTLANLTIYGSFRGQIGLPETHGSGASAYPEHRDTYLKISATVLNIGEGTGGGSSRLKINVGSVACTMTVFGTGTPAESGLYAVMWQGTHASNVVNVYKGSVGVAILASETATIATLRVGYTASQAGDATVRCESGVTLTTILQLGGTLTIESAATTITKEGGELITNGSGAITTINNYAGTCHLNSTGTVTTLLNVGKLDFSGNMSAKTVTSTDLYKGAELLDPNGIVTFTNGVDLNGCRVGDVKLDFGSHRRLTIGAAA